MGHHASIWEHSGKEKQSTPQGRSAVTNEGVTLNPSVASFQASSTSMFVSSKSSVLLQTARANISKPGSGEHSVNARMVFDSGSQKISISENLENTLKLPVAGQDTLLIKTFGESTAKLRQCDIVQFAVDGMTRDETLDLQSVKCLVKGAIKNAFVTALHAFDARQILSLRLPLQGGLRW